METAARPAATLIALILACAAPLSADNYPRQPGVDVQSYTFRVTLSDDTDEIAGETGHCRVGTEQPEVMVP